LIFGTLIARNVENVELDINVMELQLIE